MKKHSFLLLIGLLCTPHILLAYVDVQFTPSKTTFAQNEEIRLELRIVSDENISLDLPNSLSGTENLNYIGTSNQTSYQYVNGKSQTEMKRTFSFLAQKNGDFSIPGFEIEVSGKKHSIEPIQFRVESGLLQTSPGKGVGGNIAPPQEEIPTALNTQFYSGDEDSSSPSYTTLFGILFFCVILVVGILLRMKQLNTQTGDSFLPELPQKLSYPSSDDPYFFDRVDEIFREKLENILGISLQSKSYGEIEKEFHASHEKYEAFQKISTTLIRSKYGNFIVDKTQLIQDIRDF